MKSRHPRVVLCADAARWGAERCARLVETLAPVAPPGLFGVWDRDPANAQSASSFQERLERLERLRAVTLEYGHELIVGARVDLAVAVGADGVHLPEHGAKVATVRESFPMIAVSRSCHDREGLERAQLHGASWATLSPFRIPRSKVSHRLPLGEAAFSRHIAGLNLPVLALGGLSVEDITSCQRAGAVGVAISGSLFESSSPERLLEGILGAWAEALKGL